MQDNTSDLYHFSSAFPLYSMESFSHDSPDINDLNREPLVTNTLMQPKDAIDLRALIEDVDKEALLFPDVYKQQGAHAEVRDMEVVIGNIQAIAVNLYSAWEASPMAFHYRCHMLDQLISERDYSKNDEHPCIAFIKRLLTQAECFMQQRRQQATKSNPFTGLNEAVLYVVSAIDIAEQSSLTMGAKLSNYKKTAFAQCNEILFEIQRYCAAQKRTLLQYFASLGSSVET